MTRARDNPFAAQRVLAYRYQPQGWAWDELMARLGAMQYRGAIVGPEGSGKTTLLEDLQQRLADAGLPAVSLQLRDEKRRLDAHDWRRLAGARAAGAVVMLDGAEQLSFVRWRHFLHRVRHCRGLIVTLHRPGRLPTLVRTTTSPELLRTIAAALDPGATHLGLEDLFARHAGNVREALRELYDQRSSGKK
jgi:hypothetical protein